MTIQQLQKRKRFLSDFQNLLKEYDASIYAINDGTKDFPSFKFEVAINPVFDDEKQVCPFDNFKLSHIDKDSYE